MDYNETSKANAITNDIECIQLTEIYSENEEDSITLQIDEDDGKNAESFSDAEQVSDFWCTDNQMPNVENFLAFPGMKETIPDSALGFIQLFISRELLEHLLIETNKYARQFQSSHENKSKEWKPVTLTELAKYLGLTVLMGIVQLPEIAMYWALNEKYGQPVFYQTMSYKRYIEINKYLHFNDNENISTENSDRLFKIRPVITYLLSRYKKVYVPKQELSLDEGQMPWRGRLGFKVYNPLKPDKYGVKFYILAEAESGYVVNFEIYSGKSSSTHDLVLRLTENLKNKYYKLYMDNYYNSVKLAEALLTNKIYCCGTLRLVRGAPKDIQAFSKSKIPHDSTIFKRKGNVFIILWKDKRVVNMISTCNNAETEKVEKKMKIKNKKDGSTSYKTLTLNKPKAICDYNKYMKGVDHLDQMTSYYKFARKSYKWTKKIVMYMLQMSLHNSFVLYNKFSNSCKPLSLLEFHKLFYEALINFTVEEWPFTGHSVLQNALQPVSDETITCVAMEDVSTSTGENNTKRVTARRKAGNRIIDPPTRLQKGIRHDLVLLTKRKRCRVCYKSGERKDTKYECVTCKIPLCPAPCNINYHKLTQYWKKK